VALLRKLNGSVTAGISPDVTLLFDVPVGVGLTRRRKGRLEETRIDRESRRFHERVRRGFLALAKRERHRIRVIDASQSPDAVAADVARIVMGRIERSR
jgi:dTMP kinase